MLNTIQPLFFINKNPYICFVYDKGCKYMDESN